MKTEIGLQMNHLMQSMRRYHPAAVRETHFIDTYTTYSLPEKRTGLIALYPIDSVSIDKFTIDFPTDKETAKKKKAFYHVDAQFIDYLFTAYPADHQKRVDELKKQVIQLRKDMHDEINHCFDYVMVRRHYSAGHVKKAERELERILSSSEPYATLSSQFRQDDNLAQPSVSREAALEICLSTRQLLSPMQIAIRMITQNMYIETKKAFDSDALFLRYRSGDGYVYDGLAVFDKRDVKFTHEGKDLVSLTVTKNGVNKIRLKIDRTSNAAAKEIIGRLAKNNNLDVRIASTKSEKIIDYVHNVFEVLCIGALKDEEGKADTLKIKTIHK